MIIKVVNIKSEPQQWYVFVCGGWGGGGGGGGTEGGESEIMFFFLFFLLLTCLLKWFNIYIPPSPPFCFVARLERKRTSPEHKWCWKQGEHTRLSKLCASCCVFKITLVPCL